MSMDGFLQGHLHIVVPFLCISLKGLMLSQVCLQCRDLRHMVVGLVLLSLSQLLLQRLELLDRLLLRLDHLRPVKQSPLETNHHLSSLRQAPLLIFKGGLQHALALQKRCRLSFLGGLQHLQGNLQSGHLGGLVGLSLSKFLQGGLEFLDCLLLHVQALGLLLVESLPKALLGGSVPVQLGACSLLCRLTIQEILPTALQGLRQLLTLRAGYGISLDGFQQRSLHLVALLLCIKLQGLLPSHVGLQCRDLRRVFAGLVRLSFSQFPLQGFQLPDCLL
mmetsp:Transcript_110155/g.355152  ORF Transcript_110155/g.355152 Transcript_110155/m.355152 type:complete len:277 (+) Transcript_110155:529-1359(+)